MMKFEEVRSWLKNQERENDQGVYTNPDAVYFLISRRKMSLVELAEASSIPLSTVVSLPGRSIWLASKDAEAIACVLETGVSDFTSASEPQNSSNVVSYDLLDQVAQNLSSQKREHHELEFG